jgi:hypothetical protein
MKSPMVPDNKDETGGVGPEASVTKSFTHEKSMGTEKM